MPTEREWVESVKRALEPSLTKDLFAATSHRLPYAFHIASYKGSEPVRRSHEYQTDLLIGERLAGNSAWAPRVVVEFKLGNVSTHDALTYSAKAATHKNVHPYLRYGIVIGGLDGPVPKRLMRHGHHFDFMVTIHSETLTAEEQTRLVDLLLEEASASRTLDALLSEKSNIRVLRRKLEVAS
jgi:hypothetical protein